MTNCQEQINYLEPKQELKSENYNITYIKKSEITTISYIEEWQEIESSLLYKEFNKSKNKQDLENFDKYLIILEAIALAEQKPEDFEHRYWIDKLIQKQLWSRLELKPDFNLTNFRSIWLTPIKTEDVKKKINQKLQEIKQKYYPEQLERLYLANQWGSYY